MAPWLTSKQHEQLSHLWLEVDGCTKEVECWGVLLHGKVNQAQVIQDLPVKWGQVVCSLQTADGLKDNQRWQHLNMSPSWWHLKERSPKICLCSHILQSIPHVIYMLSLINHTPSGIHVHSLDAYLNINQSSSPAHASFPFTHPLRSSSLTLVFSHQKNPIKSNQTAITNTEVTSAGNVDIFKVWFFKTYRYILFLAKETHANVVPERSTFGSVHSCYPVFGQRHIKIIVALHHASSCHDCFRVWRVIGHGISKALESFLVLTDLNEVHKYRRRTFLLTTFIAWNFYTFVGKFLVIQVCKISNSIVKSDLHLFHNNDGNWATIMPLLGRRLPTHRQLKCRWKICKGLTPPSIGQYGYIPLWTKYALGPSGSVD